jgi:hypothetical protein
VYTNGIRFFIIQFPATSWLNVITDRDWANT